MPDINVLLDQINADGTLVRILRDPRAQFGTRTRRYIGAEILPERLVSENAFREDTVRYRSVIANAGTRYGPVQRKGGAMTGWMNVQLAENDIGNEFTSRLYDGLLKALARNDTMESIASLTGWFETFILRPLLEWNERARWQALVDAAVLLVGDNEYSETVGYMNPAGHRAAAAGAWSNNAVNPFVDILAMARLLKGKGFTISRIISTGNVTGIMGANTIVQTRVGGVRVSAANGQFSVVGGRASLAQINQGLADDGLPPIEEYDLTYNTSTGTGRFLKNDVMVFVCTTGRDEQVVINSDTIELLEDTLGYVGVGRPAGQAEPGRATYIKKHDDKPPRIDAQGWQTSLPVITEPEAVAVITGIA